MPQADRRSTTLLVLSGVFLFLGGLLITMPAPATMTLALFLPGLYCIWAGVAGGIRSGIIGLLPALLGIVPAYVHGSILYMSLYCSGLSMFALIRRDKIGLSVVAPTALIMLFLGAGIAIHAEQSGISVMKILQTWVHQVMNQVAEVYTGILTPADMASFNAQRPFYERTLTRLLPAMTAATFAFLFWANLLMVVGIEKRPDLKNWRTPDSVVALFILAGACTLVASPVVQTLGVNLLILVSIAYFFQGFSIVAYYLSEHQWSRVLRWAIYLLILSQFYIIILTAALGLFDTWFYFRKRIQRKGEEI
ncbi:MAG TPA: DUF2232 domain-containing protein [Deltaproteobacteria bacterium]|nr:DUF2232 domain-containing protein [Deltaproteobacteria bacterium]